MPMPVGMSNVLAHALELLGLTMADCLDLESIEEMAPNAAIIFNEPWPIHFYPSYPFQYLQGAGYEEQSNKPLEGRLHVAPRVLRGY